MLFLALTIPLRALFDTIVAFSAVNLLIEQTHNVLSAMLQYVFLHCKQPNRHLMTRVLEEHGRELGKRSDVVLLTASLFERFRWMNNQHRPFGHFSPFMQCPKCRRAAPSWDILSAKAPTRKQRDNGIKPTVTWRCQGCPGAYSQVFEPLETLHVGDQVLSGWSNTGGGEQWLVHSYVGLVPEAAIPFTAQPL
jgi:hypothetical protein